MNNTVTISGLVVSPFKFSHKSHFNTFYTFYISIFRKSGTEDIIPVIVSKSIIDITKDYSGQYIQIDGQFRSRNQRDGNSSRLVLYVFAESVDFDCTSGENANVIFLDGHICIKPTYRETPFGREISDILIAVKRNCGTSDYIPCVAWGRNAKIASGLGTGCRIQIVGRIQSREYSKELSGNAEKRIAYEISIKNLECIY